MSQNKAIKALTEENKINECRALLIGVITPESSETECNRSLDELERLADTAGITAFARLMQSRVSPDPATYIGKGKIEEARNTVIANNITLVIVDDELSPSQIKNLEEYFNANVNASDNNSDSDNKSVNEEETETNGADERVIEVIDRTMLILEIFSMHAHSGEGKLQVEIALLRYTMPRLTGKGTEMSRLGGGAGGGAGARRGAGETKLEIDRRNLKGRIASLEGELRHLETSREVMRSRREKSGIPNIAIAGYTNSGKSTLLNYLTDAGILAEDKLFATLDPTTRKLKLPNGTEVLLTDTVGFIKKLPHHLVKAFKSTLDEIIYADIILIVADVSDSDYREQLTVTKSLLDEMGAADKPVIIVYNKTDKLAGCELYNPKEEETAVYISAKTGDGIDNLLQEIIKTMEKQRTSVNFIFPLNDQSPINNLYKNSIVVDIEYREDSIAVKAVVDSKTKGAYKKYMVSSK